MDADSRLIVGQRVSAAPNDKEQLVPTVAAIATPVTSVAAVLADTGFYSEAAVRQVEQDPAGQPTGTIVYAALEKTGHHRTVADLEAQAEPVAPPVGASVTETMKHRLKTALGKAKYCLRQQTVEPVFGIIKSVLGLRQFHLRGQAKVDLEWCLVCVAYNLKRLHRLVGGQVVLARR